MSKKYVLVSFDDERIEKISEVLANKTCKKIINFIVERKQASQKDISDSLKIPMNTLDYSVKKLVQSGLIEKSKIFFWSKKGKKIINYKVSNTSIVISPKSSKVKSKFNSIFPAVLLSAVGIFIVKKLTESSVRSYDEMQSLISEPAVSKTAEIAVNTATNNPAFMTEPISTTAWFGFGIIFALLIFAILNWRKL
jgi:predicted transcriptional regulator